MDRNKALEGTTLALRNCITAKGIRLSEVFTNDELSDFANTVIAYLPKGLDYDISYLEEDLLNFADNKRFIIKGLKSKISEIYVRLLNVSEFDIDDDDFIVRLHHLLFHILLMLKHLYKKDIDVTLEELIHYHNSLLLSANELKENVSKVDIAGISYNNKENTTCVRISNETYSFIPSIKTLTNFKHLIPKQYVQFIEQSSDTDDDTNPDSD